MPETVTRDDRARRFELTLPEGAAELVFRRHDDRLVLVHTGVPDDLAGRGIGGRLVTAAVDHAIAEGLTIVPRCPFARAWLRRHPDVAEAVAIDWS
ncbi:MAG TPA: GNAT family N-acetyltransferase [Acidimicrobiia bacterium]